MIEPKYSEIQLKALGLITYLPASLSLVGSISIVYSILSSHYYRRQQRARSKTYDRIMLGLSCMEATCALGLLVFGSWAVPQEASALSYGASGTTATCEAAGVFTHILFGTMMYTAMLALYFCLRVRFQLKEEFIARRIEPFLHAVPILMVVVFCVVGLTGGYFNPLPTVAGNCWFRDYPPNCSSDPNVDCIRGENFKPIARVAATGVILFAFLIIVICMALILAQVMVLEYRLRKYAHQGAAHNSTRQWKRTREVGLQALQYIGFFFLCGIWAVILQLLPAPTFPIVFCMKLMTPLQGMFNAIIFWNRKKTENLSRSSRRTSSSKRSSIRTSILRKLQAELQVQTGQSLEEASNNSNGIVRDTEMGGPETDENDCSFHCEEEVNQEDKTNRDSVQLQMQVDSHSVGSSIKDQNDGRRDPEKGDAANNDENDCCFQCEEEE
ncbi:expressed unknown protein [Seminavis robusta]|uniref:G-protein coupled receptors family 2 profile 2 domain-containing protein n=1 Tax=Seminavis robusta TaxID=568900 RepID=A0A9N8EF88_9STRA|nr:expressed unknown protein [Seminavis robusta]|eukprot:Sro1036_g234060.1 n/a (441) ;mRNA; f:23119-24441